MNKKCGEVAHLQCINPLSGLFAFLLLLLGSFFQPIPGYRPCTRTTAQANRKILINGVRLYAFRHQPPTFYHHHHTKMTTQTLPTKTRILVAEEKGEPFELVEIDLPLEKELHEDDVLVKSCIRNLSYRYWILVRRNSSTISMYFRT